jgi:hypothetical protein
MKTNFGCWSDHLGLATWINIHSNRTMQFVIGCVRGINRHDRVISNAIQGKRRSAERISY